MMCLYVKNQEFTEYVGGLVDITLRFLSGMYIGVMRCTELRYIENPRDVCWGCGH